MQDTHKLTPHEAALLIRAQLAPLVEQHGPAEAARMFNDAARRAGSTIRVAEDTMPEPLS